MTEFWLSPLIPSIENAGDIKGYRVFLRQSIFDSRLHASDISGRTLYAAQLHEGLISRAQLPSSIRWSWQLFSSINCFLLNESEHIPQPPLRTECYWISVSWYTKRVVDDWINSLPFKVAPAKPWRGSHGYRVIQAIASHYPVTKAWRDRFFDPRVIKEIDCEG